MSQAYHAGARPHPRAPCGENCTLTVERRYRRTNLAMSTFAGAAALHPFELSQQNGAVQEALNPNSFSMSLGRDAAYASGFLIHAVTVAVMSRNLFMPFVIEDGFPVNRGHAASLPVLAGFAALYLRRLDAWSLDAWYLNREENRRNAG
jgi:hypothetical protein